jgi:predicted TIM-barrel fold metal-dependent hydrolase
MAKMIDWHAHHTAPEVAERIRELTGKRPHIDAYDSPDLTKRIKEMDEVGLDLQLICQGAGVYADQLPPQQALEVVRQSNNILAERIAPHKDRLAGITALSLKNIDASIEELERTAQKNFRAVLLYPMWTARCSSIRRQWTLFFPRLPSSICRSFCTAPEPPKARP